MTGHGNLTFQNNVPAPAPGGLQFAAEGLSVEGGDTVVLGAAPGDPATFFTNERQIDLQGFGLRFIDSVIGGDSLFDVGALQFNTAFGFAQLQAFATNLTIQRIAPGGSFGSIVTLDSVAGTDNGSMVFWQVQSEGVFPDTDGDSVIDTVGGHFKLFNDTEGFQFFFGNSTDALNVPFLRFESVDANGLIYAEQNTDAFKYAMTVRNNVAGSGRSMLVAGDFNQLDIQTTDAAAGNARVSVKNSAGTTQGYFEYNTSGNFVRHQASSELRFITGVTDRVRLTTQLFVNASSRFGSLTTAPTAKVHCSAQAAGTGTAPLKFDSSATLMTTPENGAFEFDGTELYFTKGGTRRVIQMI